MKTTLILHLCAVLAFSPWAAEGGTQDAGDGALAVSGNWEGNIRNCPNILHPSVDELRQVSSAVRLRVHDDPGGPLAFEFLDEVPFLIGVRGFAASLDDDGAFSVEVPYNLVINGRPQDDAQILFRGDFKRSRRKERLRFTAKYSLREHTGVLGQPFCLSFDFVRSDDRKEVTKISPQPRKPDVRADDLDPDAEAAVDLIMRNLRAERTPCAQHYATPRRLAVSACGVPHSSFGEDATHVLRIVDGVLTSRFPEGSEDETWVRDGEVYRRFHDAGTVTLRIEFDATPNEIAIYYPVKLASCPELEGVPSIGELSGAAPPTLIPESHVFARFPGRARSKKASGSVLLRAVIRTDGSIGPVCVLRADPPGLGFEESATEAVRQWRYRPATVDGDPVEIQYDILMDFGF